MPCDISDHPVTDHQWPPEGSAEAHFFKPAGCEIICAYCPMPQTGDGRKRYGSLEELQNHVGEQHPITDPETLKEIKAHDAVKFILDGTVPAGNALANTSAEDARFKLIALHAAFYLREDRRQPFQALAHRHLQEAIKESGETSTDLARESEKYYSLINTTTLSFVRDHGPYIWPPGQESQDFRKHLQVESLIYSGMWYFSPKRRQSSSIVDGPIGTIHSTMNERDRQKWARQKRGSGHTSDEDLLYSQLGRLMKEYFHMLWVLRGESASDGEGDDEASEEQLRDAIVTVDESDQQQTQESDGLAVIEDDERKVAGDEENEKNGDIGKE